MLFLTPKDLTRAARWFQAISDETRLQIIERLSDDKQCVCDLTDMLATTQPPPSRSLGLPPAPD